MWFDDWSGIVRVLLMGLAAYISVVVFIRVAGKRALAQLNAFDLVVTVALGSTLATILLTSDVAYVGGGAVALALLLALQVVVAFATKRVSAFRRLITATPAVLARDGVIDDDALRRHRVTRADVLQAIRSSGRGDLASVGAVTLESNGTLSVIPRSHMGDASALHDVESPQSNTHQPPATRRRNGDSARQARPPETIVFGGDVCRSREWRVVFEAQPEETLLAHEETRALTAELNIAADLCEFLERKSMTHAEPPRRLDDTHSGSRTTYNPVSVFAVESIAFTQAPLICWRGCRYLNTRVELRFTHTDVRPLPSAVSIFQVNMNGSPRRSFVSIAAST